VRSHEQLAAAQMHRDEQLAYLERARRTDDARWVATLVARHPLLAFEALDGTTGTSSTTPYRS
jgi:hypothetical protein